MRYLYSIAINLYAFAISVASLFDSRARLLTRGRSGWQERLRGAFSEGDTIFWFHCASLGEFEQGRPLIEEIRESCPGARILVTFFSPSGYEIRKDYQHADLVLYLPADTRRNARRFIELASPSAAIFIKYEFWYNYLAELQSRDLQIYLVSGVFRREQPFFRFYGSWFRRILARFTHIFVQEEPSAALLGEYGIGNVTVSGDTRFDRVWKNAMSAPEIEIVREFAAGGNVMVAGSSWQAEEEFICRYINEGRTDHRWVIAPHQVDAAHIAAIEARLNVPVTRYSAMKGGERGSYRVLIIDNIGILSSVYRYGAAAVVGGGFGKGIHNILEPASWGCPVLFGPNHHKFSEAAALIAAGGGFSFSDYPGFSAILDQLLKDEKRLGEASAAARKFVSERLGATAIVLNKLSEQFLTSPGVDCS